ncbi:MAG: M4 family metallopeptidase [Phycisphaerae bacterium]|jgi:Zn-dependent metalloprotease
MAEAARGLRGREHHDGRRQLGNGSAFAIAVLSVALCGAAVHAQPQRDGLAVHTSRYTGLAQFVTAADGGAIPVPLPKGKARPEPADFFKAHGHLFGITDAATQLALDKTRTDTLGQTHTTYRQVHKGVPVFAGVVKVHQDAAGRVRAANGDFFPIPDKLDTKPTIDREAAKQKAIAAFTGNDPVLEHQDVTIVDPGWYGDRPQGARLAYLVHLADASSAVVEAFFVDAHTGRLLDRWSLVHTIKNRLIFDGNETSNLPGTLRRSEGGLPVADFEINAAYDWAGDTYDYYSRAFGRDSIDDNSLPLAATVHSAAISCPNAQWRGGIGLAIFCTGTVTDDILAHEFTHGITGSTARLVYQNQPGQLNEAYSDIFGELVDLFNGDAGYAGAPGGTPWPAHPTGPGVDTPNNLRSDACMGGVSLEVNTPPAIAGNYVAAPAFFGPPLSETGVTGGVVRANPVRACSGGLTNALEINGHVALIERGDCNFTYKVKLAQQAGAIAVIIFDNAPVGYPPSLGGEDPTITIPSIGITHADGELIEANLLTAIVNVTLAANVDTGEVRWLVGEDSTPEGFGGAIRDMWNPVCAGDPDRANSPFQTCNEFDNGGVHSGSGIPNHAFAIMTDGKTFNGYAVDGIGPIKAAAVWYRALTTYLTAASDFEAAYAALNQAATDLIGTFPLDPRTGLPTTEEFTAADAAEVDKALRAVEMNTVGACGEPSVVDDTPPELCDGRQLIYADNFEHGANGWSVDNTNPPTPYDWVQTQDLPYERPGTAWYAEDRSVGDCDAQDESAVHYLASPPIVMPLNLFEPKAVFTHSVFTESGYDGGNLWISVGGGPLEHVPGSAFTYNAYNTTLIPAPQNTNPLAATEGYSGVGDEWGTSVVDLSGYVTGGETVYFRFAFGKDGCAGYDGWYVDEFMVFSCRCFNHSGCDDGEFCNGAEKCNVDVGCFAGADPCPGAGCDEAGDFCVAPGDGDFNSDARVDLRDAQRLQQCIEQPATGECAAGDMTPDLVVNLDDLPPWVTAMVGP